MIGGPRRHFFEELTPRKEMHLQMIWNDEHSKEKSLRMISVSMRMISVIWNSTGNLSQMILPFRDVLAKSRQNLALEGFEI
jgi:hypothetical protein